MTKNKTDVVLIFVAVLGKSNFILVVKTSVSARSKKLLILTISLFELL